EAFLVPDAARRGLAGVERPVLAISGGLDSMVLLSLVAKLPASHDAVVATFDHGTGPAATEAVALVASTALRAGVQCVTGTASAAGETEEDWRSGRWQFLSDV